MDSVTQARRAAEAGYGVRSDLVLAALDEMERRIERLLNVARGCHDYNGGHHGEPAHSTYHHGIQTVINVLEASVRRDDYQLRVLEAIGRAATKEPDHA